jgi:hypothetical protein
MQAGLHFSRSTRMNVAERIEMTLGVMARPWPVTSVVAATSSKTPVDHAHMKVQMLVQA